MVMIPRVMIIIAARSLTGPAKGVFQLLTHVDANEAVCHLFAFRSNGREPSLFLDAARASNIQVTLLNQQGKSYLSLMRQAADEVRSRHIDIVQTHGFKPSVIGLYLKYRCRIPWICFMHGTTAENIKVRLYDFINNCSQLFADRVMLVARAQRRKIFGGKNRQRVRVLHNAIETGSPVRLSGNGATPDGVTGTGRLVVAVGRLSPEKGFDLLIDAFAEAVSLLPDIRLIIVGDGQERDNLQVLANGHRLAGRIYFAGYTETPGDYMTRADLIVLPSRSEGIPNVALEAMALAKPVVATRVGGTPEVIRHQREGLLVPPEKSAALAAAMVELLENKPLAEKLAANGFERVCRHFSPQRRTARIVDTYHELVASPKNS